MKQQCAVLEANRLAPASFKAVPHEGPLKSAIWGNQLPPVLLIVNDHVVKFIPIIFGFNYQRDTFNMAPIPPFESPAELVERSWVRYSTHSDDYVADFEFDGTQYHFEYSGSFSYAGEGLVPTSIGYPHHFNDTQPVGSSTLAFPPNQPPAPGTIISVQLVSDTSRNWVFGVFDALPTVSQTRSGLVDMAGLWQKAKNGFDSHAGILWPASFELAWSEFHDKGGADGSEDYVYIPDRRIVFNGGNGPVFGAVCCVRGWRTSLNSNNVEIIRGKAAYSSIAENIFWVGRWQECQVMGIGPAGQPRFPGLESFTTQTVRKITYEYEGLLRENQVLGEGILELPEPDTEPFSGAKVGDNAINTDCYFAVIGESPDAWAARAGVQFGITTALAPDG